MWFVLFGIQVELLDASDVGLLVARGLVPQDDTKSCKVLHTSTLGILARSDCTGGGGGGGGHAKCCPFTPTVYTPLYYSSFHFLFHYAYIAPILPQYWQLQ